MDISIYKDKNGNLNKNWKRIHKENPSIIDGIISIYSDPKTKLILALNNLDELPKCKKCDKELPIEKIMAEYCSRKCSASCQLVKDKKLSSIDIESRNKKISESLKGKPTDKTWVTRKKKYGENGFSSSGINAIKNNSILSLIKREQTCLNRYGVKNPFQIDTVKASIALKQSISNSSRTHLPEWLYDKEKFSEKYKSIGLRGISLETGCGLNLLYGLTFEYNLRDKNISVAEIELKEFIDSLGFACETSRKIIAPFELDIYIPEKNLAIEFNGIYWHSSGSKEEDIHKRNYHLNKTELCESKGIQLLHIFENEWLDNTKREIWKSVIKVKLGKATKIHARKCKIKQVSYNDAKKFCELNHLQGHAVFTEAKGLYYEDDLVQLITIGKGRYQNKPELLRMCSKLNTVVQGGASRLLKGVYCVSYANRRWSQGNVYNAIGMKQIRVTKPCDYYIDKGKLFHRSSFMKHLLDKKLDNYNPELTAVENCYNNKIRRIWDSGNLVFESI